MAPAPAADPDAPATGTLRVFAYGDTVPDEMLDPFREANPDVDLKVATFDSNKAAAAKLAGGFEADVVEVCTDEMEPLLARGLLRPLDESGDPGLRRARLLRLTGGPRRGRRRPLRPRIRRPHGLIVNTEEVEPGGHLLRRTSSTRPSPASVALEATPLTAIGASGARARASRTR